jgi:hypothetical protein
MKGIQEKARMNGFVVSRGVDGKISGPKITEKGIYSCLF